MNEWIKKNTALALVIGVAALGLIGVLIYFAVASYTLSIKNEGERYEQDLTQVYGKSLNSLSTCLDQGQVAAQVTEREFETLKEILIGVSAARYTDANGEDTDASGVIGGGQLFSALAENYPTIDQRSWQNLQTTVVGCRDEFQGRQDNVLYIAGNYNKWIVSDDVFNAGIKSEFPSDELKVQTADGTTLYGQAAYDRITHVVSVEQANMAFETGELEEQNLFGED